MAETVFHLFERFGVELEYMLVSRDTLDIAPIADRILEDAAGETVADVEVDGLGWSNELALHVIELKTAEPATRIDGLAAAFQRGVQRINELAARHDARLMPTAMHPWMDPFTQTRLWPHDNSPVYEAFDRIFDCRGHGWSNLQSVHLNLPFADDEEFGRLHAAIRLLLPIMPALAASSPLVDGRLSGLADTRLDTYRTNCARIPQVTGRVIPEPVFTRRDYDHFILEPMYAAIAPHDPQRILQCEWLNARGAIARFERNTIEIRVLDVQECPQADLAIVALITATLRAMIEQRWTSTADQKTWLVEPLEPMLFDTMRAGADAMITDPLYLAEFGCAAPIPAGKLWGRLADELLPRDSELAPALGVILNEGPLSSRIRRAIGDSPTLESIGRTYMQLCQCLSNGEMF